MASLLSLSHRVLLCVFAAVDMWLLEDREVSWPSRTVLEEGSFFFWCSFAFFWPFRLIHQPPPPCSVSCSVGGAGTVTHTNVGGSINNAMNISEHCGETRLLISNNDEKIKVYSLPSLTHVTSIQMPTAVNNGQRFPIRLSLSYHARSFQVSDSAQTSGV